MTECTDDGRTGEPGPAGFCLEIIAAKRLMLARGVQARSLAGLVLHLVDPLNQRVGGRAGGKLLPVRALRAARSA